MLKLCIDLKNIPFLDFFWQKILEKETLSEDFLLELYFETEKVTFFHEKVEFF